MRHTGNSESAVGVSQKELSPKLTEVTLKLIPQNAGHALQI